MRPFAGFQFGQGGFRPRRDAVRPGDLPGGIFDEEIGGVRRLRAIGAVEIPLRVAHRAVLVHHRGVQPLGQRLRARHMRRQQHDAINRRQLGFGHREWIAGRRVRHLRVTGFGLVEQRQAATARPAGQHDALIPQHLAAMRHPAAEIDRHLLHDQRIVVVGIARHRGKHVHTRIGQRRRQRQIMHDPHRVHEDHDGIGSRVRLQVMRLQRHHAINAAIGVAQAHCLAKGDQQRDAGIAHAAFSLALRAVHALMMACAVLASSARIASCAGTRAVISSGRPLGSEKYTDFTKP